MSGGDGMLLSSMGNVFRGVDGGWMFIVKLYIYILCRKLSESSSEIKVMSYSMSSAYRLYLIYECFFIMFLICVEILLILILSGIKYSTGALSYYIACLPGEIILFILHEVRWGVFIYLIV